MYQVPTVRRSKSWMITIKERSLDGRIQPDQRTGKEKEMESTVGSMKKRKEKSWAKWKRYRGPLCVDDQRTGKGKLDGGEGGRKGEEAMDEEIEPPRVTTIETR